MLPSNNIEPITFQYGQLCKLAEPIEILSITTNAKPKYTFDIGFLFSKVFGKVTICRKRKENSSLNNIFVFIFFNNY